MLVENLEPLGKVVIPKPYIAALRNTAGFVKYVCKAVDATNAIYKNKNIKIIRLLDLC